MKEHNYKLNVTWTGNTGLGTNDYKSYERSHTVKIEGKELMYCSSDAPFRGDVTKYNPEDLLLASLSACHMLWYLHLCADAGIVVTHYSDNASGILVQDETGGGKFKEATLNPVVTIVDQTKTELAMDLHKTANKRCFIANSVNFPVLHKPDIQ